ncbi:MAG TPA: hypothetical protein VN381_16650 [Anaerovoracaceae bacterium]|nr:hypothetical protein [Anaerovoracaceae bacterium]
MGEIIFSIFVGGWMVLTGIFMNYWLTREEKNTKNNEAKGGV